jgi:TPR repeat protein
MSATDIRRPLRSNLPAFPYPGLRAFEPEEWPIFFGRETMIDEVIDRLADARFVLIHGSSGSGKSSLVRAGVLPKLARQHLRHGAAWQTCAMRPSGGPLWNLAAALARLEGRENDHALIGDIIRRFNGRGATLTAVGNTLQNVVGKRICILIDQFEELFYFEKHESREEAELFIDLMIAEASAVHDTDVNGAEWHIVITMRSEYLGDCARFNGFAEVVNRTQYLVPRLALEDLTRAIRQPAQLFGGEVSAGLADRLIADVRGQVDELPLIQHGLMLLWSEAGPGADGKIALTSEHLEDFGGLMALLSDHASRVMRAVAPDPPRVRAVEWLFRSLTDINADGQPIRRPQAFNDLVDVCGVPADTLRAILDGFRAEHVSFITPYLPESISDRTTIDISHEALIRSWALVGEPQLGWIWREFDDGLAWRSLLMEAHAFELNRKHVLSAATVAQRGDWIADRRPAWCERYGGNRALVERLLAASRAAASRSQRRRRLVFLPVVLLAGIVPPIAINMFLFGGLSGNETDIFVGIFVVAIAVLWAVVLLVVTCVFFRNLVVNARAAAAARFRRATAPEAARATGKQRSQSGPAGWRRWLNWRSLRRKWYSIVLGSVLVLYIPGLIYTFARPVMNPLSASLQEAKYEEAHGKYTDAEQWFEIAATLGNLESQVTLGDMYFSGDHIAQNWGKAFLWYQLAADQGDAHSEFEIGWLYDTGQGVQADLTQAVIWYRKAAEQGDAKAEDFLGFMYDQGRGVKQDYQEAMRWYLKAAGLGNLDAYDRIGMMYYSGHGVSMDYEQAMTWYLKAAEKDDKTAENNLGAIFEGGPGVPTDYAKAMAWYAKAADNTPAAQYHIGTLYAAGHGVTANQDTAIDWMCKATAGGEARAEKWLRERVPDPVSIDKFLSCKAPLPAAPK